MGLEKLLAGRRSSIIKSWFQRIIDTYPPDTSLFLKKQSDPFANPVGSTTLQSLNTIFDELLKPELDPARMKDALDPIVRIRSVQTMFTPSQAAGFPFYLKTIIRKELSRQLNDPDLHEAFMAFELKIDAVGLQAFDLYMKCREAIFKLRTNEERERIYRAFSRAGLVKDLKDEPEDAPEE